MNNQYLWNSVESFSLDNNPNDPYNFSIRLAFENKWSEYITQQAILEYKKFMFLAATSGNMVSPSEVVDIVWHQHLLFSQSYDAFCSLLGKRIDHVPSTHNPKQKVQFAKAKEYTKKVYEENFGKQPEAFWSYSNPYDSIPIQKSSRNADDAYKVLGFMLIFGFGFYLLTAPLIRQIPNPYFLLSIISLWIVSIAVIFYQYKKGMLQLVQSWKENYVIANLSPMELISIKNQNPAYVTHYYISRMIRQKNIRVTADNKIKIQQEPIPQDAIENVLYTELKNAQPVFYANILKGVNSTPLLIRFNWVRLKLAEKFHSSKIYVRMILSTASVLGFLMMILLVRLITGLIHDKNIFFLVCTMVLCFISAMVYLKFIQKYFWTTIFPEEFKKIFIQKDSSETMYSSWQWKYFLGGVAIAVALQPMVGYTQRHNGGNCGSSCGSSCSSSCGSGGGSCGGGGCGGCGGGGD